VRVDGEQCREWLDRLQHFGRFAPADAEEMLGPDENTIACGCTCARRVNNAAINPCEHAPPLPWRALFNASSKFDQLCRPLTLRSAAIAAMATAPNNTACTPRSIAINRTMIACRSARPRRGGASTVGGFSAMTTQVRQRRHYAN
jgi:hypothetical protein